MLYTSCFLWKPRMRRWQCWSGQPHQNVLMALGTQRTDQRSKHPRYPSGFRALKHAFGRSQMTSNWYHFVHICWRVLFKLYCTSLLSSLPRSLSREMISHPVSFSTINFYTKMPSSSYSTWGGALLWHSPAASSSSLSQWMYSCFILSMAILPLSQKHTNIGSLSVSLQPGTTYPAFHRPSMGSSSASVKDTDVCEDVET